MAVPADLRNAPLLELDPELCSGLSPADRAAALREAIVTVFDLEPGSWLPDAYAELAGRPFGLLVVEGLVVREIVIAGTVASDLHGPGDLIDVNLDTHELVPHEVRWSVPDGASLAVLDLRARVILRRWPAIGTQLLSRAVQHATRASAHRAIVALPRVEDRLLGMFGYLAERWGHVSGGGIVVPLELTHEALGRLVGARRPTVSLALTELAAGGQLARREDGGWVLAFGAFAALEPARAEQPGAVLADVHSVGPLRARREVVEPRLVSSVDVTALGERVRALSEQHDRRRARTAESLARCASVRERVLAARAFRPPRSPR